MVDLVCAHNVFQLTCVGHKLEKLEHMQIGGYCANVLCHNSKTRICVAGGVR